MRLKGENMDDKLIEILDILNIDIRELSEAKIKEIKRSLNGVFEDGYSCGANRFHEAYTID